MRTAKFEKNRKHINTCILSIGDTTYSSAIFLNRIQERLRIEFGKNHGSDRRIQGIGYEHDTAINVEIRDSSQGHIDTRCLRVSTAICLEYELGDYIVM